MPLVLNEAHALDTQIGVWKIEETEQYFLDRLLFSDWERNFYESIHHHNRKMSWLASRYLLKVLLQTNEFVELLIDVHGKPFLGSNSHHISLSHTHTFAAAIISKSELVGIDVEDSARDISIIAHKFLSDTEKNQLGTPYSSADLLLYWGAKEVIYKMYGKKKVDFRRDMFIKSFEMDKQGQMTGILMKNQMLTSYRLHYVRNDIFSLVTGIGGETKQIT